ncbi:MAG: adenylosuccinate synthase [Clostridiales bacterium]|nr:adenylosuccinate synthase [Clostridiales bacterium]
MSSVVLVGTQWGDEGKGRFVDFLASKANAVVRFQGGDNAGHTVEIDDKQFKLHLVPSGIFSCKTNIIGSGVVVNPVALVEELNMLKKEGVDYSSLRIASRAQVIMPWHMIFDTLKEEALGRSDIGTTRKGIGPAYMDRADRVGIRICDLIDFTIFEQKARELAKQKNEILTKLYNAPPVNIEEILVEYKKCADIIRPYITDTVALLHKIMENGENVLFEGAQGTLLDLTIGTYPYVTSSNPISGGVCIGAGIGPTAIDNVLGIVKAYTTRVGKGPFVTELLGAKGEEIREKGHEYGATTGRPRRCGWLDTVILNYSAKINGLTHLAISRMDTLGGVGDVKICTGYKQPDGTVTDVFPARWELLSDYEPVYETLPGWTDDISHIRDYDELPENAKAYLKRIEKLTGVPIVMIGVGANRVETIVIETIY